MPRRTRVLPARWRERLKPRKVCWGLMEGIGDAVGRLLDAPNAAQHGGHGVELLLGVRAPVAAGLHECHELRRRDPHKFGCTNRKTRAHEEACQRRKDRQAERRRALSRERQAARRDTQGVKYMVPPTTEGR